MNRYHKNQRTCSVKKKLPGLPNRQLIMSLQKIKHKQNQKPMHHLSQTTNKPTHHSKLIPISSNHLWILCNKIHKAIQESRPWVQTRAVACQIHSNPDLKDRIRNKETKVSSSNYLSKVVHTIQICNTSPASELNKLLQIAANPTNSKRKTCKEIKSR